MAQNATASTSSTSSSSESGFPISEDDEKEDEDNFLDDLFVDNATTSTIPATVIHYPFNIFLGITVTYQLVFLGTIHTFIDF